MTARPLRIGLVCPYSFDRPGGVQNHVLGLAGWLRQAGHQVSVLAPGRPGPVTLHRQGLSPADVTSAGRAVPVPWNGAVARVNCGPVALDRVQRWLDAGCFDVVHVHEPMTPSISLLALARSEAPVVATFHTAATSPWAMAAAHRLVPWAAGRIDAPLAVSRVAADLVGASSSLRPVVIGNGIRLADHPLRPRGGSWRGGAHPVVTFVGRFHEPRKGFQVLLDALPAVRAAHPGLVVRVVGPGRGRHRGVDFLGALDDTARNAVLAATDAYVAPQTGRESFGIVLLEALASGAPVVASALPAFVEVASDGDGPVADLFEPGDPRALADALLRSLARPRDELLDRGRARAGAFDWSVIGPQVAAVHERVVGTARPPRPRPAARGPWRTAPRLGV